ncbi:hypothetical protein BEN48_09160 [Hymenobacter glacialis]|uniref:Uncharacterized protein n=2 Tax=Hymenobacter glacialis TaxID=1908236 RepID=A0A1G1TCF0_9BACT|nr:hypothetical protein BEN48_09160 [Hymenobacter glacialis]
MSAPLHLPLLYSLNVLPQHLSADDSLARLHYARRRVKTVVLTRAGQLDTTEYTELDRRGNTTLLAKPYFGQPVRQRFDGSSRLVEVTRVPKAGEYLGSQTVYEPVRQLYTSYALGILDQPLLWQQSHRTRRGDTLTMDANFQPLPGMEDEKSRRLLLRSYPLGRDTTCSVAIAYDAADTPTEFLASYTVRRAGRVVENGTMDFQPVALGTPLTAPELLRASRTRRGRPVPRTRNTYDAKGGLIETATYFTPAPSTAPEKEVKSRAADGSWTLTSKPATGVLGYTRRYVRNPAGLVKREERTYQLGPGTTDDTTLRMFRSSATDYEYDAHGLLLRKTESPNQPGGQPLVSEVRYTYY